MLGILILMLGAYFRFAQLPSVPPEMTSDHVEKLFDVHDLVNGQHWVYFERNTGREPIQFYFAAFLVEVFNTGFTHLTLKITSAIAGFLMLPFVFLLGREITPRIRASDYWRWSWPPSVFWATAISRVGPAFPGSPCCLWRLLPQFFHLRGIRRHSRDDFLLVIRPGSLGIGPYG